MTRRMMVWLVLSLLIALPLQAQVRVIASMDVAAGSIDKASLQKIFLGTKTTWDDGKAVVPVTLVEGATHGGFVEQFLEMSVPNFSKYWKKALFSGTAVPPAAVESEAEVTSFVTKNKGAIGYIDTATLPAGVKELSVR